MRPAALAVGLLVGAARADVPCALDPLPDGSLRWTEAGVVELLAPNGETAGRVALERSLDPHAVAHCAGATVRLTSDPDTHHLLALDTVTLDFTDVLEAWASTNPTEQACTQARAATGRADWSAALQALAPFPDTDPRVARARLALGRAWAAALPASGEQRRQALVALEPLYASPGWTEAEQRQHLQDLAQAHSSAGRPADAALVWARLTQRAPTEPGAWLALGDARWSAGDKGGAREAYAQAAALTPTLPEPARSRCKACQKD